MDAFLGTIVPCLFTYAPDDNNWMVCDGRALSTSQFASLFSLIGNTFGGDAATFNIPDLRGRVPIGAGAYSAPNDASANYALGQQGGSYAPSIGPHTHIPTVTGTASANFNASAMKATTQPATQPLPAPGFIPAAANAVDDSGNGNTPPIVNLYGAPTNPVAMAAMQPTGLNGMTATVQQNTGSVSSIANMQPSAVVNYMICVNGIYPQRP